MGWTANGGDASRSSSRRARPSAPTRSASRARTRAGPSTVDLPVNVVVDIPTAQPPVTSLVSGVKMGRTHAEGSRVVAGRPPIRPARSPATRSSGARTVAPGPPRSRRSAGAAMADLHPRLRHRLPVPRACRRRGRQLEPVGPGRRDESRPSVRRPQPVGRPAAAAGDPASSTGAYQATLSGSAKAGAKVNLTFTGHARRPRRRPGARTSARSRSTSTASYNRTISLKTSTSSSRQVVFTRGTSRAAARTRSRSRVVGTGTYPLVRLDAFVVSRVGARKVPGLRECAMVTVQTPRTG